jgi:uncharacterized SAM-binding protein YcdF (DUF218 family)
MGRFGIMRKKEGWSTTWFGKLLILILMVALIYLYLHRIYPFLSQSAPVESEILVVEGFLPDHTLMESIRIFEEMDFKLMLITGKKMAKGVIIFEYENDGQYSAAILEKLGFDPGKMRVVGLQSDVKKDRTYASAKAVKEWLAENGLKPKSLNLVSLGCHSRRSRLLFEKAFGDSVNIGVIGVKNIGYDPENWWRSSFGFKDVMGETIAWIYARFFFWPEN